MALKLENINNLISDDLDKRNENWTEIDNTFELKADKATTYTKTEVDTSLGLKANKQQEAWITPTLENGATSYNGTDPYGYFKDEFGMVHLRGTIKTLGVGATFIMFTLPIGYRPEQDIFKSVTSNFAFGNVTINKFGLVVPSQGNQNWFCLTGISFKAGA